MSPAEGERERLKAAGRRSSREDLLRGFDLLTRAEQEIATSDQPRYNLEMALLRLMHLRKLVPLDGVAEVRQGRDRVHRCDRVRRRPGRAAQPGRRHARRVGSGQRHRGRPGSRGVIGPGSQPPSPSIRAPQPAAPAAASSPAHRGGSIPAGGPYRDAFLAEVKAAKVFFYNTVVAQAYRIDVQPRRIYVHLPAEPEGAEAAVRRQRAWLEEIAEKVAGQKMPVHSSSPTPAAPASPHRRAATRGGRARARRATSGSCRRPSSRPDRAGAVRDLPGREDQGRTSRVGIRAWHGYGIRSRSDT